MSNLLSIFGGFIVLFVSGKFLITGGVQIARFFKLPTLVIGLTVVALGTSAPELLVSLKAAFYGHPDISIGNVVGSNISNIALVLGITALIYPISVTKSIIKRDWTIMMIVSIIFFLLSLDNLLNIYDGVILLGIIILYNFFSVKHGRSNNTGEEILIPTMKWYYAVILIVASSVGLMWGADFLISGASELARLFGIEERVISVSMIAFGTSVPELTTSVIAAIKKETDISIGNIIGSNIFNIGAILGITSTIKPIKVSEQIIHFDSLWMIGISLLLLFVMVGKRHKIRRVEGLVLLSSYCAYMYFLLK